jgi:hypothetical protein
MHAYEISPNENATSRYRKNLRGVREVIRQLPRNARVHARVILFDAPINQDVFVGFLNGEVPEGLRCGSGGCLTEAG